MLRKLFMLVLALSLLLTACQPAAPVTETAAPQATEIPSEELTPVPTPEPIIVTDGLGREITLAGPAQKIVSLSPSNTEILFAIGSGAQVVGRDDFSDFPEEAAALPSIGGWMGEFNLEQIVALEPDLVLAGELNAPELIQQLEELGLSVYYLSNPVTLEDLFTSIEAIAVLTGASETAEALTASLEERVIAIDEKIKPLSFRPTVFYQLDGTTDASKPWTAGPGTFVDLLIDRAGGFNIGGEMEGAWAQMSLEQLVVADPDIILLGDAMWGVTPESVAERPGWGVLSAVQNGQVFPFDDNLVSRPGPRLVDGLEALAKLLHPEAFE